MSQPTIMRAIPRGELSHNGEAQFAARKVRCRFAQGSSSGPGFTDEMSCLLRTRLRSAILIILSAFVLHFLRNLLLPEFATDHNPIWLVFSGCEIGVMALASAMLWSRLPLNRWNLRILELTIFGSVSIYIAGLQWDSFHNGVLLHSILDGQERSILRLVGISSVLRWCLLIITYGIFIPNTWKRCAAVVGSMAAIPIVLMIVGCLVDQIAGPYLLAVLPEAAIVLSTASGDRGVRHV